MLRFITQAEIPQRLLSEFQDGELVVIDGLRFFVLGTALGANRALWAEALSPSPMVWGNDGNYNGSTVDTYCETTYVNALPARIRNALVSININIRTGATGTATSNISRRAFAPTLHQLNLTNMSNVAPTTSVPPQFVSSNISRARGTPYWTRTVSSDMSNTALLVNPTGSGSNSGVSNVNFISPVIVLPNNFMVQEYRPPAYFTANNVDQALQALKLGVGYDIQSPVPNTEWILLGRQAGDWVAHYRGFAGLVFVQVRRRTGINFDIIGTLPEGFRPLRIGTSSMTNPGVQFAPGGGTGFYVVQHDGRVRGISAPESTCFCFSTIDPN
jgi:hypothetical protein